LAPREVLRPDAAGVARNAKFARNLLAEDVIIETTCSLASSVEPRTGSGGVGGAELIV
jgi:hypothetical protein